MRNKKRRPNWTIYTPGYCIRIYYNPRNPEKKIPRVTLRAADRIEASDRERSEGERNEREEAREG